MAAKDKENGEHTEGRDVKADLMVTLAHWASRRPALFSPVQICPISMAPSRPTTSNSWSLKSGNKEKVLCSEGVVQFHFTYVSYLLITTRLQSNTETLAGDGLEPYHYMNDKVYSKFSHNATCQSHCNMLVKITRSSVLLFVYNVHQLIVQPDFTYRLLHILW